MQQWIWTCLSVEKILNLILMKVQQESCKNFRPKSSELHNCRQLSYELETIIAAFNCHHHNKPPVPPPPLTTLFNAVCTCGSLDCWMVANVLTAFCEAIFNASPPLNRQNTAPLRFGSLGHCGLVYYLFTSKFSPWPNNSSCS